MTPAPASAPAGSAARALAHAWQASVRRRLLFETRDRDCAQAVVGRIFRPHQLEPGRGSRLHARMEHLSGGLLGVSSLAYGDTVDILPGPLEDFYLLQIPVEGGACIETAGRAFRSDAGCASLVSPAPDLRMRWESANAQLCVRIEAAVLQRFVAAWCGRGTVPLPTFEPRLALDEHPLLVDTLLSLIEAADEGALGRSTAVAAALQQRLLALLLGTLPHDAQALLDGSGPPLAPRCVRLVEEYLVAHCDEALTPESLATLAGVSVRSLFLGFRRYRGVSPMRLLRELRLRRVRDELLQAAPGTRVTEVALRWGLTHLGRFAHEYEQAYGETPSQTLRALGRA